MNVKGLNNRLVESNGVKLLIKINESLDAGMDLSLQEAKELYYLTSLSEQNAIASINGIIREEVQIIAEEFSTAKVILESLIVTEENEALAEDIRGRIKSGAAKIKGLKVWDKVSKEKIKGLAGVAKGKIKAAAAKAKAMGKAGYEKAKPHVKKAAKETAKMGKAVGAGYKAAFKQYHAPEIKAYKEAKPHAKKMVKAAASGYKAGYLEAHPEVKAGIKAFKGERASQRKAENIGKLKAYAKSKYEKGVGAVKAHKKAAIGGAAGAGLLGAGLAGHHLLKKKD